MSLIRPFTGLRPAPGRAAEIIAPPYDVLSTEEALAQVNGRPWSFLHVSRPEIDLPADTDLYAPQVYVKAKENLDRLQSAGLLQQDATPHFYVYRLTMGAQSQTGLVAAASVAAYETNRIKKHELTRPVKEDDRVRHIEVLNAQTGPVFLAYKSQVVIDSLFIKTTQDIPEVNVIHAGVRHELWAVSDPAIQAQFIAAFDTLPALYIADGHHRAAAAARVAKARRLMHAHSAAEYFLAVIFPHHHLRILDYNRLVRDLNGLETSAFLQQLAANFDITPAESPVAPAHSGEFGLYLEHQWYRLQLHPARIPEHDPVQRLDVSLLTTYILEPLLGIVDQRRDERIEFVGGIRGLLELQRRVDDGEMRVAFSLFPPSLADLMAVADANAIMPPKSTWFEPKLADGLVSHVLG